MTYDDLLKMLDKARADLPSWNPDEWVIAFPPGEYERTKQELGGPFMVLWEFKSFYGVKVVKSYWVGTVCMLRDPFYGAPPP